MTCISLICTVRDEASTIVALLDSMRAQARQPDEIVINDCQSRDHTADLVSAYAARYPRIRLVYGGYNIASGRNNAIRNAYGTIIACTDAGLTLDRDWLAHLLAPIEDDTADYTHGIMQPAPTSLFETVLAATNFPTATEIDPRTYPTFGASMAFRKQHWQAAGGFPEWLDHSEDLVFTQAMAQHGARRVCVPQAVVTFQPRSSLPAFARQYYHYARGDGRARLWTRRHLIRYGVYATALSSVAMAARTPRIRAPLALLGAAGVAAYTRTPYRRLLRHLHRLPAAQRLPALALVPLIRLAGDSAKMAGYPVGRWQRWQAQRNNNAPTPDGAGAQANRLGASVTRRP